MVTAIVAALWWIVSAQLTSQTPADSINKEFLELQGTSWRVFAVDSYPAGPVAITQVQEIRQHTPPSTWGVFVRNRSAGPVASLRVAAAIVTGDGHVKAIQPLPAIQNLKLDQTLRQELRIRVTVLMPTDRVVFYVDEVSSPDDGWKASRPDVDALIGAAARRLPVP
jgi:hypothetical protein